MIVKSCFFLLIFIFDFEGADSLDDDIFYSASLERLSSANELNRLKNFGVKVLVLNDVECFEKALKTLQIDELIEVSREMNLKILIDLRDNLRVNLGPSSISKKTKKFPDQKVPVSESLTRMKNIVKLWLSRNVDGFKVILQGADLQLFKSVIKDESKIILTETRDRINPLGVNLLYIFQGFVTDTSCSLPNVGWKLESHVDDKESNLINILKILSSGFVVLDESINLSDLQPFLELRKHETLRKGDCEMTRLNEDFLILKRELTSHDSFTAIFNMKPKSSTIDLTEIGKVGKNLKVFETSYPHSVYNKG